MTLGGHKAKRKAVQKDRFVIPNILHQNLLGMRLATSAKEAENVEEFGDERASIV